MKCVFLSLSRLQSIDLHVQDVGVRVADTICDFLHHKGFMSSTVRVFLVTRLSVMAYTMIEFHDTVSLNVDFRCML